MNYIKIRMLYDAYTSICNAMYIMIVCSNYAYETLISHELVHMSNIHMHVS